MATRKVSPESKVLAAAGVGDSRSLVSSDRLIRAAVDAFAARGFHGTTTRDIAKRAELSPAALYVHYTSKDELLLEIMVEAHEEVLRLMREAAAEAGTDDPVERLTAITRAHVRFHAEHSTLAQVANYELPALSADGRRQILRIRHRIEQLVDDALKRGVDSGAFAVSDRRATTFLLLSVGIGVFRWFSPRGRLSADQLAELYANLVVHGLLA
jgi:AcrR family transcriptional regulator